jgi:Right handed beta helix region
VDGQNGSDGNNGAQSAPLKTIQAAINAANAVNQKGNGVSVEIAAGVYRESVSIAGGNLTNASLTVESTVPGGAIIAGSDVLTGWTEEGSSVYSHAWTYNLGSCNIPSGWPTNFAPIAQRTEMVFVNGVPLTQVMSRSDLQPGTFFVDDAGGTMYVSPSPSTNMATAVVEAAARRQTLSVSGRTNVTLRGLVFRHAANCFNTGSAAVSSSSNVLVDSVQALWNNWGGLALFSTTGATVQNSIASNNGGVGFTGDKNQNLILNSNESDYNNWRGAQAALYDWAMGGTKLFATHTGTVQNHFSYNNQAQGLWFDTDNSNITIDNATLSGNKQAALQIERNEGPITLENSHLCSSGVGANVLTSENLAVQNNVFYNNSGTGNYEAELFIGGQAGGINITDWQTGQVYDLFTTGMALTGNTFLDAATGQLVFGTYLSGTDWSQFATTLKASNNEWYDPTDASAFKIAPGKLVNLAGWQGAMGTDLNSVWQMPSASPVAACAAPVPSFADFAVSIDNGAYTMASGQAVVTARVVSYGSGTVTLQPADLPSGVTASLSTQSLASGVATLTLTSSPSAVAQNVPITLFAISGSRVHSVTFYVQVSPH